MTQTKPGWPLKRVLAWVLRRVSVEQNKDVFWLVVGDPGTGKSTWMFQLACLLDAAFSAARAVWSMPRFMALANDAEAIPPGSVVMIDEGIVGGHRREAMTRENRDASKFLSVFRYRRLITLVAIPFLHDVDSSMVRRAHLLTIVEESGSGVVAKTFKRNRTRHFSKKGPGWQWIGTYPYGPVTERHPKWGEWLAIQDRKDDAVQRMRGGEDDEAEAVLVAKWRSVTRKVLKEAQVIT